MQRNEAVVYLKEILTIDSHIPLSTVTFERPHHSSGYQLRIRGAVKESDKQTVKEIARKHRLAVKEEDDQVIVYKP
ncbi:MAG: hypothetical protein NWE98_02385 [Candidatus Bathyarchaeota archaeon]|nr:hypothetical protein [Candidatus Bathyarchaeota archaeon]